MLKQIRVVTLLIAIFTVSVLATIPRTITYQGLLTDPTGNPVADGKQNIVFTLYDAATAGTALWSDELTDVSTSKGMFSVLLGSKTPLAIPFDKQYWIEIKVNSKIVSPRVQLSASAYAMRADTADMAKNAIAAKNAFIADSATVAKSVIASVLAGKADAGHRHSVLFRDGKSDTILVVDTAGNVGIGTNRPICKAHFCDTSSKFAGVIVENTNPGSRGPGIVLKKSGSILGVFSSDGLIRGDDSSNIGIISETGKKISFYTDGSAREKLEIMQSGNVRVNNSLSIDSGCSQLHNTVEIRPAPAGGTCKIHSSYWKTPGDLVVGTYDYRDNQLYLSKNGNVGIGTVSPATKLHVSGGQLQCDNDIFSYASTTLGSYFGLFNSVGELPGYPSDIYPTLKTDHAYIYFSAGNHYTGAIGGEETNFQLNRNSDRATQVMISTNGVSWLNGGNVGIGTTTPAYALDVSGNIRATGWTSNSDRHYKTDVTPLDSSLNKISQLQGVNYKWNTAKYPEKQFSKGKQIGLIAQDVEMVIPEVVHTDNEGYKSLSYDKLTAVLIEAVKTLKAENEALQRRMEALERGAGMGE